MQERAASPQASTEHRRGRAAAWWGRAVFNTTLRGKGWAGADTDGTPVLNQCGGGADLADTNRSWRGGHAGRSEEEIQGRCDARSRFGEGTAGWFSVLHRVRDRHRQPSRDPGRDRRPVQSSSQHGHWPVVTSGDCMSTNTPFPPPTELSQRVGETSPVVRPPHPERRVPSAPCPWRVGVEGTVTTESERRTSPAGLLPSRILAPDLSAGVRLRGIVVWVTTNRARSPWPFGVHGADDVNDEPSPTAEVTLYEDAHDRRLLPRARRDLSE